MLPHVRFTREQCARGGRARAARARTRNRAVKTDLLALTGKGMSITRAADELGIAPSTACRILADDRIVPVVPNLYSPAAVPRVTDRHYAAMQRHLSPARVRVCGSVSMPTAKGWGSRPGGTTAAGVHPLGGVRTSGHVRPARAWNRGPAPCCARGLDVVDGRGTAPQGRCCAAARYCK